MIGSVFEGRYTVNGFLAEGPIFTLYSARDKLTARDISLRLLKPPFAEEVPFKLALEKSIERTSFIQSPFVERLFYVGTDGGKSFLIGELTRAPSLGDRIRKLAPFTSAVAASSVISILRGLDSYHKINIAHGDISGENVAMLGDGDSRLQLGGIWPAYSESATAGILVLPSLAPYLAPEISNGELPDPSSDLYAVGIILFELLTGRRPYQADTGLATAMRHSTEPTPRVRSLNPSIPGVLDEIVYKAMSKDPSSRYRNCSEFLFDLRQTQDALRFGRNLSWPIVTATPASSQVQTKVQVAPKMSAIRDLDALKETGRKAKPERDVPVWMLLPFFLAAITVVILVAANFVIGATSPRPMIVPQLQNMTVAEARAMLQSLNLKLKLGLSEPSDEVEADHIIDSNPPHGEKVAENSSISVNVSLGSREVAVPELRNLSPDKAREALADVNLELDDNIDKVNDPSVQDGMICRQDPPVGKKLARSGKVHVAISSHSGPDGAEDSKKYQYNITVPVTNTDHSVDVRIDMIDDDGTKQIFDDQKDPGEVVETKVEGKERATFIIYYDDKEIEEDVYEKGKLISKKVFGNSTEENP